jgi:Killing trait
MSKQPNTRTAGAKRAPRDEKERSAGSFQATIDDLLKLYQSPAGKGASPQATDAVTQALLMALGSGPTVAALESMTAASQASGLMFHNAVANQQKVNIEALVATAECIRKILNVSAPLPGSQADGDRDDTTADAPGGKKAGK